MKTVKIKIRRNGEKFSMEISDEENTKTRYSTDWICDVKKELKSDKLELLIPMKIFNAENEILRLEKEAKSWKSKAEKLERKIKERKEQC